MARRLSKAKAAARAAYAESLRQPAPATQTRILQEPNGEHAALIGFERSVPRCETCRFIRKPMTIIHKSTTTLPVVLVPPVCRRGKFYTRDTALCDHWTSASGETLAKED